MAGARSARFIVGHAGQREKGESLEKEAKRGARKGTGLKELSEQRLAISRIGDRSAARQCRSDSGGNGRASWQPPSGAAARARQFGVAHTCPEHHLRGEISQGLQPARERQEATLEDPRSGSRLW